MIADCAKCLCLDLERAYRRCWSPVDAPTAGRWRSNLNSRLYINKSVSESFNSNAQRTTKLLVLQAQNLPGTKFRILHVNLLFIFYYIEELLSKCKFIVGFKQRK